MRNRLTTRPVNRAGDALQAGRFRGLTGVAAPGARHALAPTMAPGAAGSGARAGRALAVRRDGSPGES